MSQMGKKKISLSKSVISDEAHLLPTAKEIAGPLSVEDGDLFNARFSEIAQLLWFRESVPEKEKRAQVVRALELYESLKPADGAEGMLAAQMVGTHMAALECLRRAVIPKQSLEGRDMALKNATKLMALYTKQLQTLNKGRGKGQQKVTVEHVHVEAGGQAFVGHMEAAESYGGRERAKLADQKTIPNDLTLDAVSTSRKVR